MKITSHSLIIQIPPDLADDPELLAYTDRLARERCQDEGTPIPPGTRPSIIRTPTGATFLHWQWLAFDDGQP